MIIILVIYSKRKIQNRLWTLYKIYKDLDGDLPWDGEGIPADNQLRDADSINAL